MKLEVLMSCVISLLYSWNILIVITKHNFMYIKYIDWQEELLQEL